MFLLMVSASRCLTVPITAMTYSLRSSLGLLVNGGVRLVVEHDLGDAGAVADVDKNEVAEVAAAVHPSHEDGFLAGVGGAQCAAHVGASQVA